MFRSRESFCTCLTTHSLVVWCNHGPTNCLGLGQQIWICGCPSLTQHWKDVTKSCFKCLLLSIVPLMWTSAALTIPIPCCNFVAFRQIALNMSAQDEQQKLHQKQFWFYLNYCLNDSDWSGQPTCIQPALYTVGLRKQFSCLVGLPCLALRFFFSVWIGGFWLRVATDYCTCVAFSV